MDARWARLATGAALSAVGLFQTACASVLGADWDSYGAAGAEQLEASTPDSSDDGGAGDTLITSDVADADAAIDVAENDAPDGDTALESDADSSADVSDEPPADGPVGGDGALEADAAQPCDAGLTVCSGLCTDTRTNGLNCGDCGISCSSVLHAIGVGCSVGMCGYAACAPGFGDCDGIRSNGCERDITTVNDCGACAHPCDAQLGLVNCVGGACEGARSAPRWPMPNPASSGLPHPASYRDNGDGTVSDLVTGLMWQSVVTSSYAWPDSLAYCGSLVLGGYRDWRIPSRIELVSLVDFTNSSANAAFDLTFFPTSPNDSFWSSSATHDHPGTFWYVWARTGGTIGAADPTALARVRCVRSGASAVTARWLVESASVTDLATGLEWTTAFGTADAPNAASYCSAVPGGSWRVPSMKELQTLVDESRAFPAIDVGVFPGTPSSGFLTSSPAAWTSPAIWNVAFDTGATLFDGATSVSQYSVRCVR